MEILGIKLNLIYHPYIYINDFIKEPVEAKDE